MFCKWVFLWAFIATSAVTNQSVAEDRRTDRQRLSIMTMNTYFMWDGIAPEDGTSDIDIPWRHSATEANEHMQALANVIARNNPDIIHLVEVENRDAVERFRNGHLPGRKYRTYFDQGADTYTGQDVALLTRIDPDDGAIHYDNRLGHSGNTRKKVSKNYRASVSVGDLKILIVGLHFLARPNDESRIHSRQAQADAIRNMVIEHRCSTCEVIVLGDFNDYDGSDRSRDHIDSTPITSVLTRIKRLKLGDDEDDLINVARALPKAKRYTAFWDQDQDRKIDRPRELTSIDHVLVSKRLFERIESVSIDHTINPVLGRDGFVSDHFPIIVNFNLSPNAQPTPRVRLIKILPNPVGDESQNEEATISNDGNNPVDLIGWKLVDRRGTSWRIVDNIQLAPGTEITIKRNGQEMAMTNTGDTIELRDQSDQLIDSISYTVALEGEFILSN